MSETKSEKNNAESMSSSSSATQLSEREKTIWAEVIRINETINKIREKIDALRAKTVNGNQAERNDIDQWINELKAEKAKLEAEKERYQNMLITPYPGQQSFSIRVTFIVCSFIPYIMTFVFLTSYPSFFSIFVLCRFPVLFSTIYISYLRLISDALCRPAKSC
jgi:hypothetical protein